MNQLAPMERIVAGERLLAILRCLWKLPGQSANEQVVSIYLRQVALYGGGSATRDALDHLERLAALTTRMHATLMVAELTRRGSEAAEGTIELEGVPKPGLDCPY